MLNNQRQKAIELNSLFRSLLEDLGDDVDGISQSVEINGL